MKSQIKAICSVLSFSLRFAAENDRLYIPLKILGIIPDVIFGILTVSIPRYIIDSVGINKDIKAALLFAGALVLTMLLQTLLTGLLGNAISLRDMRLNRKLSEELQRAAARMPYAEFESRQTLDDYGMVREFISEITVSSVLDTVFSAFSNLLKLFSYLYILLEYSWIFMIVLIASTIVRAVCQNREEIGLFKLQEKTAPLNRRIGYVSRSVMDYSNAKEVRVFRLHDFIAEKFDRYMKKMYSLELSSIRKLSPLRVIAAFTQALFLSATYGLIGLSLYNGDITVGTFIQYTGAVIALAAALSGFLSAVVALKNQNQYVSCYLDFVGKYDRESGSGGESEAKRRIPMTIELQNLSFRYPESETYVLKNINLTFHLGEKIAIVGKNGAGKTTLIKLLLGLYTPTEGRILLDGKDISEILKDEYSAVFSAAFQDSELFRYSVRENISFDRPFDEERAEEILRALKIWERLERCEDGLETYVTRALNENGSDFSGGERKRILIARALYREAGIYIFDEPTAELSPRGEQLIYDSIFNLPSVQTVFFISHRLASCKRCSRIVVFDSGAAVGDGTHDELMAQGGLYAEMFSAQAEAYREEDE
ncbi:MAG: ABC transporter ATP-binding protein [Clostridiales bacterium]|nr:ABC transporter ATP-binding protein [Clostridiales bacterium]